MWYLAIVFVFLNPVLAVTNDSLSVVCCTECSCNVTESSECVLPFQQKCNDGTCIYLNFEKETSIIELELSIEYLQNATNLTQNALEFVETDEGVKLEISEFDSKEYVLLEAKHLHINNLSRTSYLTRTPKALICTSFTRESSDYIMKYSFKEIEYRRYKPEIENPLSESGEILGENAPNSVTLYKLPKDPKRKWKGIEITIQDLQIDAEKGEYILIGAGSSDDFPPRFLSHISNFSVFYVANASAYIEIVSNVRKEKPFKIMWDRKDLEPSPEMNPMDILNSVLLCFHNYSRAEEELTGEDIEETFPVFREKFAQSAKNYLKKNKLADVPCLDKSSVKFIGPHTEVKSLNALSILIVLGCNGKAFRYQELQNIARYFEENDKNETLGYKVGICPDVNQELPYKEKWSFLIYALVPAFALFILMVWAWRNNIFAQKCKLEKQEKFTVGLETNTVPVVPNMYEQSIPKVRLEDGRGRRQTLIQGSAQEDTERINSDNFEMAVEMNDIPSTSQEPDTLTRVLTSRRNKRRPSIQSLIPINEEIERLQIPNVQIKEGDESEHLYDSVNGNKQIRETKL